MSRGQKEGYDTSIKIVSAHMAGLARAIGPLIEKTSPSIQKKFYYFTLFNILEARVISSALIAMKIMLTKENLYKELSLLFSAATKPYRPQGKSKSNGVDPVYIIYVKLMVRLMENFAPKPYEKLTIPLNLIIKAFLEKDPRGFIYKLIPVLLKRLPPVLKQYGYASLLAMRFYHIIVDYLKAISLSARGKKALGVNYFIYELIRSNLGLYCGMYKTKAKQFSKQIAIGNPGIFTINPFSETEDHRFHTSGLSHD